MSQSLETSAPVPSAVTLWSSNPGEAPSTSRARGCSHGGVAVKQLQRRGEYNSRWETNWRWVAWGCAAFAFSVSAWTCETTTAQSAASREYMESSSPLKKGGVVTSLSLPGQAVQTTITRTALNPGPVANSAGARPLTETSVLSNASPTTDGGSASAGVAPSPATPTSGASSTASEYPYPVPPPMMSPNWNGTASTSTGPGLQLPTLGITPNSALRPRWGRWPAINPWSGNSPLVPDFGSSPPGAIPADLPPSINYPQNELMTPGGTAALSGPPPSNFWQNQSVYGGPGSNAPAIRWRNMPPGTYLGQGLVGQPKAYVDGQPIRNLLRFLAPF